jgi:SAM-dependent methyltransferase
MTKEAMVTGMRNVDHTAEPGFFVRYLDTASAQEPMQALKRRTFALLAVPPGAYLLDVGCGPGDDVQAMAQLVGRTGRVVGVDRSATMIAAARHRATGARLPVAYQVGDAQHLAFADQSFDGCRAERVLMHVDHPRQVLAEMIRVTRPGGRLVVLDPDFETLVVDAANRSVTRRIVNFLCDHIVHHGWIGRQCPAFFWEAQLTEIRVVAETVLYTDYALAAQLLRLRDHTARAQEAGVVSAVEVASWLKELEQADQAGRFFAALTFFCVSGRKP